MELAFHLWSATGTGERIGLLHGMGGTGSLWRPIAATLENHYQLMAFDQRGHGKSRIPPVAGGRDSQTYTPLDYGRDVIETLSSQAFHPTWLIGHSMGVRTACAAAHLRPDWIRGLILVDLGFFGAAGGGLGDGLAQFLRLLPQSFETREEAKQFMTDNCPDPAMAHYLMAVSNRAADGKITFPFDHAALIETVSAAKTVSVRGWVEALGRRALPILVLRGANSLVWSRQEYEEERERFKAYPSIVFR